MILYHFTLVDRAEHILKRGLLPHDDWRNIVGGERVIWLTEETDTRCTEAESAMIHERTGVVAEDWLGNLADIPVARFKVRIPSHDRKLVRWGAWSRKHPWSGMPDLDDSLFKRAIKSDWIYFGEIPPPKLIEVDVETGARGDVRYADSPHLHLPSLPASVRLSDFWRNERQAFRDAMSARAVNMQRGVRQ